jgi:AraC-like DNA-binding protein
MQAPPDVASNDVLGQWTQRFDASFPLELRSLSSEPLVMELTSKPIGSIAVSWSVASGVQSIRTAQHVKSFDPGLIMLHLVVSGTPIVATTEHTTRLGPGDLTVISSSRPYQMTQQTRHEALSFSIPRAMLTPVAERLDDLALQRCTDPVVHRLVTPALTHLGESARAGDLGHADADFGELVVSLARTLAAQRHGAREDADAAAGARGSVLLGQAKAYIEQRLHDPDLRPGEVADAQFISVRYLQKLFQAEGVTMLEWTRSARLRRARRDLADPSQGHRTIAAIAASWGFRHPGHFRRAFRAEFGITPTQFRRDALHAPGWYADCDASSGV